MAKECTLNCIVSEGLDGFWPSRECHIRQTHHRDCSLVTAMATLLQTLLRKLCSQNVLMENLCPDFVPVGSVVEGTRVLIANELDVNLIFKAWKDRPPFEVRQEDPFHLYETQSCPSWMKEYYDENGAFR